MMKRMTSVLLAMVSCGLMVSALPAGASEIKARTMRIAVANNPGHPQFEGAQKFADLVKEKTGGKIKVKVFGGATLGKDTQVTASMQGGVIEMAVMSTNLLVGVAKEAGLLDLPFLFDSPQEAYEVLDGPVGQKIHAALEPKGLVGLGYFELGYYSVLNNKRPIVKLEDMQGLKMRVTETPVSIETMAALGANPVPVPYAELYTVLEQHVVDGAGLPPINMVYTKFGEVSKYYSINRYSYTPQSFLMSKKTWDSLSAEEQKIIKDAAKGAIQFHREESKKKTAESLVELKKTTEINEVAPEEIARMRLATKPVVDKFAKQYDEALAQELFQEIDRVRNHKM